MNVNHLFSNVPEHLDVTVGQPTSIPKELEVLDLPSLQVYKVTHKESGVVEFEAQASHQVQGYIEYDNSQRGAAANDSRITVPQFNPELVN